MTRLDENRAKAQLAQKAGVDVTTVTNMAIWGNHSATQYPDFYNAKINGKTGQRGDQRREVAEGNLHSRPCNSAAPPSSRRAALPRPPRRPMPSWTPCRSLTTDTEPNDWHSVAVCSDGSYGVEQGLICSFPIRGNGRKWEIVQGVPINEFSRSRIDVSVGELKEEKNLVRDLIRGD